MHKSINFCLLLTTLGVLSVSHNVGGTYYVYYAPLGMDVNEVNHIRSDVVERSNFYRKSHNLKEQTADNSQLDRYAQQCANSSTNHDVCTSDPNIGLLTFEIQGNKKFGHEAVNAWYKQTDGITEGTDLETLHGNPEFKKAFQLLWNNSTHIGVGAAKSGDMTYVAVTFQPKGNIVGQYKDNLPAFDKETMGQKQKAENELKDKKAENEGNPQTA